MATRDEYIPQSWENLPMRKTPVSAARLLHMENGIKSVADKRALKEIYDDSGTNIGQSNTITSITQYIVEGNGNILQNGAQLIVVGNSNNVGGGFNAIFGCGHTVNGSGNIMSGTENVLNESNGAAFGAKLIAVSGQTVIGRSNVEDTEHKYAFIVGGGNNYGRKNIITVDWGGNIWCSGDVANSNGVTLDGLKAAVDAFGNGSLGDVPVATVSSAGIVKPDGKTITVDADGTLRVIQSGPVGLDDTVTAFEFTFIDQEDITEEEITWTQGQ